jgi:hypothetical protein
LNADKPPLELDSAFPQGKESVISSQADARPWLEDRTALAHEDLSHFHVLSTEALDAQALGVAIPAISGTSTADFRGHNLELLRLLTL